MILLKIYKPNRPIVEVGEFETLESAFADYKDYAAYGYSGYIAIRIGEDEKYIGELVSVRDIPRLRIKLHETLKSSNNY